MTQIMAFFLNLGTSIKNFLERSFQKELEYYEQIFFRNFSEKHCIVTLNSSLSFRNNFCEVLRDEKSIYRLYFAYKLV